MSFRPLGRSSLLLSVELLNGGRPLLLNSQVPQCGVQAIEKVAYSWALFETK